MTRTNVDLVNYCIGMLGQPYWYGCIGTAAASEKLFEQKRAQYPEQYPPKKWTKESFVKQYGMPKPVDCSGLIKSFIMTDPSGKNYPLNLAVYDSKYDLSANGMIKICTETGNYSNIPEVPGLIVWKNNHVGVYIGNGYCIEAKGHAYGVVKTNNTAWTKYGRLPASWISYTTTPTPEPKPGTGIAIYVNELKKGDRGPLVLDAQAVLNAKGFRDNNGNTLALDSSFGRRTEESTICAQKVLGLKTTGVIDQATWQKLIDY